MEWKLMNGDDKLRAEIKRVQNDFDLWFERYHSKRTTREEMLSDISPVPHVAHKMTKSFEWLKEKYPYESVERCNSCGEYVSDWLESEHDVEEYSFKMCVCKKCAVEMSKMFK